MTASPVGRLLKQWRERRRMSQLGLAGEAEISSRHLSFVETGRAQPSRDMLLLPSFPGASLGTPYDITLHELRVESFFAADGATEAALRRLAAAAAP